LAKINYKLFPEPFSVQRRVEGKIFTAANPGKGYKQQGNAQALLDA
jgi:hypothetical protein